MEERGSKRSKGIRGSRGRRRGSEGSDEFDGLDGLEGQSPLSDEYIYSMSIGKSQSNIEASGDEEKVNCGTSSLSIFLCMVKVFVFPSLSLSPSFKIQWEGVQSTNRSITWF